MVYLLVYVSEKKTRNKMLIIPRTPFVAFDMPNSIKKLNLTHKQKKFEINFMSSVM